MIPFEKRFEGRERKYIKDDYLKRKDVLEYVLYKLLATTDYYELDVPQTCIDMLEEFKLENDPVRQFARGSVRRSDVGPAPVQVHVRLLPPLVPAQRAFGASRWKERVPQVAEGTGGGVRMAGAGQGAFQTGAW